MTTSSVSALLQQGARADLLMMQEKGPSPLVAALCDRLPSSVRTEYLPFVGESPAMVKHDLGDMTNISQIKDVEYSVSNESWRAALAFFDEDLADDMVGGLQLRIRQMLSVGMQVEEAQLVAAIEGSQTGFDGVTMFSNSHTTGYGDTAISHDNLLAGTGTSAAQIATDFGTAIANIMGYTGGNGEPLNDGASAQIHVLAPWDIRANMQTALVGTPGVSEVAQIDGVDLSIHYSARLTDANDFYVFCTGLQKPFYLFDREPLSVELVEDKINKRTHAVVSKRFKIANGHYAHGAKVVNS